MRKQHLLYTDEYSIRQEEILAEADFELSGYMEPLGSSDSGEFPETEALFTMIAEICEEVGLRYKERYSVPRPNMLEPRLSTFIPNPAHASYPSNHSFQSFSIAFIFSRVFPEHPGISELFLSARRIAENREWAGLHYASDTRAGHMLARLITPVLEKVLKEQMRRSQLEWL